jgi:predicted ATPase
MAVYLKAHDFGTIDHAEIELAQLTVFTGPNNAGKSTLATLAYAATHEAPSGRSLLSLYWHRFDKRMLKKALADFTAYLSDESTAAGETTFPDSVVTLFAKAQQKSLEQYGRDVARELERAFASRYKTLGRSIGGKYAARFDLRHSAPDWRVQIGSERGRFKVTIDAEPPLGTDVVARIDRKSFRDRLLGEVGEIDLMRLFWEYFRWTFNSFPRQAYYLPAARSGILQSHKTLASTVVRRSSLVGVEDMAIPKLSGIVSDFISQLLTIEPPSRTEFADIASYLENDILRGEIEMLGAGHTYPEIWFSHNGERYQLHRTSSMVSELAPLVLYLRHLVEQDDLLVIEEPESHLHPETQTRLARAMARLNARARLLITTHSDFFLTEINNLIKTNTLAGDDKVPEAIDPRGVRAYRFYPERSGTVVRGIEVDQVDGIKESEIGEVAEALYNESAELRLRIMDKS